MRIGRLWLEAKGYPGVQPAHGPQTWPWWRLFSLRVCSLAMHPPSVGARLWLYTRRGAFTLEARADRRDIIAPPTGFTCGTRSDGKSGLEYWEKRPNGDRCCSYCGSLSEEDFIAICEAYANGEPGYDFDTTTKSYKRYARRPGVQNAMQGGIKFYGWHAVATGEAQQRNEAIYQRALDRYRAEWLRWDEQKTRTSA